MNDTVHRKFSAIQSYRPVQHVKLARVLPSIFVSMLSSIMHYINTALNLGHHNNDDMASQGIALFNLGPKRKTYAPINIETCARFERTRARGFQIETSKTGRLKTPVRQ
jgi:hypothetical protein